MTRFLSNPRNARLLGLAVILVLLEGATPVAPFQRAVGLGFALLPPSTKATVLSKDAVRRLQQIPREVQRYQRQQTVRDRHGNAIVRRHEETYPPRLKRTLLAIENHRYDSTFVLDYFGLMRVFWYLGTTGELQGGASGIAQQAARRIVLHNQDRTLVRKLKEFLVAVELRTRFTREEVLSFYLATAYLGEGIEGFAEASYALLGKPLREITSREALVLVGMLDRPNAYLRNPRLLTRRYQTLIRSLHGRGYLSTTRARKIYTARPLLAVEAEASPDESRLQQSEHPQSGSNRSALWPAVAHPVRMMGRYENAQDVQTALDPDLSIAARRMLLDAVASAQTKTNVSDIDGFVIAGLPDGQVLAMVGATAPYQLNHATQKSSWRPGSLAKPMLYGSFYDGGGSPRQNLRVRPVRWQLPHGKTWSVSNYTDRYARHEDGLDAAYCLSRSLNVPASQLALTEFGDTTFSRFAALGIDMRRHPANLIGAESMRPLHLFRSLLSFTPPYGAVPSLRIRLPRPPAGSQADTTAGGTSPAKAVADAPRQPPPMKRLYSRRAAHNTALNLGLVVTDTLGTAHLAARLWNWSMRTHRVKTGTGQQWTSASVFVTTPGGLTVMMGLFSRSGKPLRFTSRPRGMSGALLLPFVHRFLESDAAQPYQPMQTFNDIPQSDVFIRSPVLARPIPWIHPSPR